MFQLKPSPRIVAALLFGSGLAALVYQTAWQRMLRLVFGASTAASAAVLGIFLGGLGLGGAWLGKRAERKGRPLLFYGNLELLVALLAALTPLLVSPCASLYYALGGSGRLGMLGATLVRLLLAALLLGPAVVLMGGTLPAAARAVESDEDTARGRLAMLYATNTFGAVVGALLGTFLLFELFGTRLAVWAAVLINLLVAFVARSLGRRAELVPVVAPPTAASGSEKEADEQPAAVAPADAERVPQSLVYTAAGVVGFAFLCLELVWYRMLAPILGGSSFTFGLILAVALAGIGAGGYVYAQRDQSRPATLGLLATTLGLEALAVGIPLALGDRIALLAAATRPLSVLGFGPLVLAWVISTSVVVLPAALVSGYQFPVLFGLLGRGRQQVARQVGLAYAFNTIGSIAGALIGGFVLIPQLGTVGTWRLMTALLAALTLVALAFAGHRPVLSRLGRALPAGVCALLALLTAISGGPTALWRHTPIGAGRLKLSGVSRNELEAITRQVNDSILWERDGVESALAVNTANGVDTVVNGKSDGSTVVDRGTMTMVGLVPALLHPQAKSTFVLGLGTGMTTGWLASVRGIERVDVAELEPAILDVARLASQANQDALSRPNVHMFLGDGREFLATTRRSFDIIVSQPSNPYRAGIASLFTREFYELVRGRLNPSGLFVQWVQGYEVDVATLRTVLRTLRVVFPAVEIWHTQSDDLMLIASQQPPNVDVGQLRRRLEQEPFRSALPRVWLVQDVEGVLSHFLAADALVRRIGDAFAPPINTDDTTVLEYAFARQVGSGMEGTSVQLIELAAAQRADRPRVKGRVDWKRVAELRGRAWLISSAPPPPLPGLDHDATARLEAVTLGCVGKVDEVLGAWQKQRNEQEPRDVVELFVLAQGYAQAKDELALKLARELHQQGFVAEAALVRGRYLAGQRRFEPAVAALLQGLSHLRNDALPLCNTAKQTIGLLRFLSQDDPKLASRAARALLQGPLAAHLVDALRRRTAQWIAFASRDPSLCVQALGPQLERPWWEARFLVERQLCLAAARHPLAARAQRETNRFGAYTSGRVAAGIPPRQK